MMKNWFLFLMVCILSAPTVMATEREGGIKFFEGTYEEALAKAKRENKFLFIDVYTTWCGPCKKLERETFSDAAVGAVMNEQFISLRLDAENQAESTFFKSYTVAAFPTMFWLNNDGELLDHYTAFMDGEAFLQYTTKAKDNNFTQKFNALKERWDSGERNYDLYREYVLNMVNKIDAKSVRGLTEEYVKGLTEEEILSKEGFSVLSGFRYTPDDTVLYPTFIKYWDSYVAKGFVNEMHWQKLYTYFVRYGSNMRNKGDMDAYKAHNEHWDNIDIKDKQMFQDSRELENLLFDKKYKKAIDQMFKLVAKYPQHPFLYDQYYYTLILSDFFAQETIDEKQADRVIEFARANAKNAANQKTILYLAAAYAAKNDYKTAYGYLANLNFYPKPVLSNAVYSRLNLPVTKKEFPW